MQRSEGRRPTTSIEVASADEPALEDRVVAAISDEHRVVVPITRRRQWPDRFAAAAGTTLVSIGTYHDLDKATGLAGVFIADYPVLTVTREHVAPPTGDAQGSSGKVWSAAS